MQEAVEWNGMDLTWGREVGNYMLHVPVTRSGSHVDIRVSHNRKNTLWCYICLPAQCENFANNIAEKEETVVTKSESPKWFRGRRVEG